MSLDPREIEWHKEQAQRQVMASFFSVPRKLNTERDLRKVGTIFGIKIMVDMTDVPADDKDDKFYEIRKSFDEIVGEKLHKPEARNGKKKA